MAKVIIQIGFYLEEEHYAQMQAFLPRLEALKIPQLKIEQRSIPSKPAQTKTKKGPGRVAKSELSKSEKSESKKVESEDEVMQDQEDENPNEMENQQQEQGDGEVEVEGEEYDQMIEDEPIEEKVDSEKQEENLLRYLQDQEDSDDDDLDEELSSISQSLSVVRSKTKTKRQKGDRVGLMQLPDRRPRKDKKLDQATEVIRRQEKERKRKQYLKKQVEAQQKATLDKILNQTGRKLKMREEKQNQDEKRREQKAFKNLGDLCKVTLIDNQEGPRVILHSANLFPEQMLRVPVIKSKPSCKACRNNEGRYRIKKTENFACSLNCYKLLA